MKRTLILFILFSSLSASAFSQKITVNMGKVTLYEALKGIKKEAQVDFFYSDRELNVERVVIVDYKNTDVINIVSNLVGDKFNVQLANDGIILITPVQPTPDQNTIVVKGVVKNELGELLPGVNIILKGINYGTTSDFDGNYLINVDENSILVFSYVGYHTLEVEVKGRTKIDIVLKQNVKELEEVVITGIVNRDKKSFTGATKTVTREQLRAVGNLNIVQSLKTLDPSFVIQESNTLGANPNRLPNIEVRGKTSISNDDLRDEFGNSPNQPLFILDGFETTLRTIIDLDMNRVASITILKDASSTALYGAKAANGVIVVETVKPTGGKIQVTYNSDFRVEIPDLSDYNLMNSTQKLKYERLSRLWTSESLGSDVISEQYMLDKQYNATLAEVKRGVDTYWLNEPLQVGTTLGHSLYASGGDDIVTFGVGLNYKNQKGVMIGSDRETWGASFNLNYRKDKLNISNRLLINGYDANESQYGSFSNFANANPYFRKTDENGNITKYLDIDDYWKTRNVNPLYNSTLNLKDNSKSTNITNNLQAILTLNSKFRIQSNLQLNKSITTSERFLPPGHTSFEDVSYLESGEYKNQRMDMFSYNLNVMASYANVFKEKHRFTANLRAEAQDRTNKKLGVEAVGFPVGTNGNPSFAFSYKPDSKPSTAQSKYRRVNLLSSINYVYDQKYLFDFTYRIDGSTVFGSNKKFSPFWAVGAGWNLHNEFEMNNDVVSLLKIRGSIGSTGNQGFGNLSSVSIYGFTQDANIFGQGTDLQTLANPNLDWQNTLDASIGIDASLLNNRINTTFNAFSKTTNPLVVRIDLPSSTGVSGYPINTGLMNTKGIEAIIRVSPIYNLKERTIWTLGLTTSATKSEYDDFDKTLETLNDEGQDIASLVRYKDGYSPNAMWAVQSLGIDPSNGLEVFLTKDGLPTYEYNVKDERVMGNSRPTVEGVLSSNLRLKDFSMGINLRYRIGGDILNTALFNSVENISRVQRINNQDVRALTDRWISPDDITSFRSITEFDRTPVSSRFIQEENVILGESINFGYEFKDQVWIKNLGLSRLRLNAYMNEIFRISSVKVERGINYPFARSVSFSLNAYF